jgi:hypothetical protein
LYGTVELQEGERVLYEDDAAWKSTWLGSGIGWLCLTSQRLIWARQPYPLAIPLPSQPVLRIGLEDILGTEVKVPMFGSRYSLLVRARQRTYRFMFEPISEREDIEECSAMIEKARGQHETPG